MVADEADGEYKDYRSYYSYACLQLGDYNLNLYDSYGDGWNGGRITVTQMVNVSAGCQLLTETTDTSNKTIAFSITVSVATYTGLRLPCTYVDGQVRSWQQLLHRVWALDRIACCAEQPSLMRLVATCSGLAVLAMLTRRCATH